MTDQYTTSYPQTDAEPPTATQTARDETARLTTKAADAGGHLADEAKGEATAVAQEARRQLGDLWSQARSELSDQASSQQSRLASGLTSVGDQLTQMAAAPSEQNLATDIVREVGDRVDALGGWLETHGPDDVLDEVRSFARRRPGTFLLLAAGAGVVLGRLTRGLKDAPTSSASTSAPAPVATPRTASTEPLPVYDDAVEQYPRFTDELASPVPGTPATTSWEER